MNFLFKKVDSKIISLLRLIIGCWFFVESIGMMLIGWMQDAYINSTLNFPYYGFEWIERLPPIGMYLVFIGLTISSFGIALGYRFKLSLSIFFSLFLYVFMLDIVYDLNKFYLFLILAFVLFFVDSNNYWSLDVKQGRKSKSEAVPLWNLLIFQGLIAMIYFYSGLAKLNVDWLLHAEPLRTFIGRKGLADLIGENGFEKAIYLFSYTGLVFDLSIAFLLMNKRTRFAANAAQGSFHSLNFIFLGIGTLSIFTALTSWLLFPTKWLKNKLKLKEFEGAIEKSAFQKNRVTLLLGLFFFIQLSIPHRHYFTGNNVNWTEKGHRFSWRLMTRTKSGSRSEFFVENKDTGERWRIDPRDYLTNRQYRKMSAETDLVIVFAKYLEKEWNKKGYPNISVGAKVHTKLNGRRKQYLVDPSIDLSKCERSLLVDEVSNQLRVRD